MDPVLELEEDPLLRERNPDKPEPAKELKSKAPLPIEPEPVTKATRPPVANDEIPPESISSPPAPLRPDPTVT